MMKSASSPATELCVNNTVVDIATMRGTAKAFGKNSWAAINSFECQAYGGLSMRDQNAKHDKQFDKKRSNIWWLTQHRYIFK